MRMPPEFVDALNAETDPIVLRYALLIAAESAAAHYENVQALELQNRALNDLVAMLEVDVARYTALKELLPELLATAAKVGDNNHDVPDILSQIRVDRIDSIMDNYLAGAYDDVDE